MPFALCTARQELGSRLCEPSPRSAAATSLKNLISVLLRVAGQKVGFRANVKLFILNRAPGRISNRAGARKKHSDVFVVRKILGRPLNSRAPKILYATLSAISVLEVILISCPASNHRRCRKQNTVAGNANKARFLRWVA